MTEIATERCLLRSWRPEDAPRVLDVYSRWEVARWLGSTPRAMVDLAEAERFVTRCSELNGTEPIARRWALERGEDGELLGTIILVPLPDGDGEFEVGWHLHPDAWGHGYASEGARAALRWGFDHGLPEVFAVVRPDNAASLAVCRRIGMAALGRTTRYYETEVELFRATATRDDDATRGGTVTPALRTDLTVRRAGRPPGDAPTLVFLHGLTDSGAGWPGAERHWGSSYSLLAPDQRGHGDSPRFSPEQLDGHPGELMVEDATALLRQLPEPPVVIGHSLGGAVALATAARHPDLVRALVLEDPAPLGPHDPVRSPQRGQEFLAGVRESLAARDEADLLRIRRDRHPDWPEDELLVSGLAEQQVDLGYLEHGEFKPHAPWTELFPALSVPTLVVSGDALGEVCITGEVEQGLAEIANPQVELVRVPGAAHCIRREQPDAYYTVVDAFLARHLT